MAWTDAKATQQQTKAHNSRLVLSTIYQSDQISRATVARRTALSRTSVGDAVGELLDRGLVEEIGRGRPSRGRGKPPILLRVNGDARHLVGVDLSGTDFRGAVVNVRGEVRHALSLPRGERSGTEALDVVYALLDRLVSQASAPVLGLGIGTPGLIDTDRGSQVHWAVNLNWVDVPLRELLENRYGVPVYLLNDSQAAAMGEYFFGSGHGSSNLVVIKCEEGLGAGIVLGGQLFRGDHFGAGEIGHVVLTHGGARCRCGNIGCLETMASAAAIVRAARQVANGWAGDERLDIDGVLAACEAGDAGVRQVVDSAARALGLAIAALVGALNVRHIVIAGQVTRLGDIFLDTVRQEVLGRALAALARETRVDYSAIGPQLTALGAAAVLLHEELGVWPLRAPQPRRVGAAGRD
jgi:glucokinase-like ROK family protein